MTAVGARPGMFNPGDLTVFGPNSYLYPGQSGVYSSPNGLFYAQFPDASTGTNALLDYINRHVSNGWNTVGGFVNHYLGVSGPGTLNPYPQGYLSSVTGASGLDASSALNPSNALQLARGIATGEGTLSVFAPAGGGASAGVPNVTGIPTIDNFLDDFLAGVGILSGDRTNSQGQNVYAATGNSIGAQIQKALDNIGAQLAPLLFRSGFGVVGVILIVIGLVAIVASNKQVQQAVATAAAA